MTSPIQPPSNLLQPNQFPPNQPPLAQFPPNPPNPPSQNQYTSNPLPPNQLPPNQFPPNLLPPNQLPPNSPSPNLFQLPPGKTQSNQPPINQLPPNQLPSQLPPSQLPPSQLPPSQIQPSQLPPSQLPPSQIQPSQIPPSQIQPNQSKTQFPSGMDIMDFTFNLTQITETLPSIPPDVDEKWLAISGPDEFISFSKLIAHINACTDPKFIVDAFDPDSPQLEYVSSELNRHLNYLRKIISVQQFLQFTSQMRLEPQALFQILQPQQATLLTCAIYLLNRVLQVIRDHSVRQQVLISFSEYLIPEELKTSRKTRPYIKSILFLPAQSLDDDTKIWISLGSDFNTVKIYQFDQPQKAAKTFTLDKFLPDIYAEQLSFSSDLQPGVAIMTFAFISLNAGRTWIDTFLDKDVDPLLIFMSTLPHAMEYSQFIPDDFKRQLNEIVAAPDLDLARAICTVAANEFRDGEHTKSACLEVLSLLNSSGFLAQFVRSAFAEAISDTTDTTNILRMSSIASMSSGLILTTSENGFAASCAAAMKNDNGNLPNAVRHLMQLEKGFTPPMRFILSSAFRATRRKFPEYLVPLNAISSIFVLRYLATELTSISMDMAKLCQTITLTLMFSTKVEQLPDDLYPQLALFLVNLTHLRNSSFTFPPVNTSNLITFLKFTKEENKYLCQIVKRLSEILKNDIHPMVWSMAEFLENIYTGTDENFMNEMANKTFQPQRYVRKADARETES